MPPWKLPLRHPYGQTPRSGCGRAACMPRYTLGTCRTHAGHAAPQPCEKCRKSAYMYSQGAAASMRNAVKPRRISLCGRPPLRESVLAPEKPSHSPDTPIHPAHGHDIAPQGHEDRRRRKRVKACSVTHLCGGGAGMRAGGHASRTRTLPIASAARCCDVMRGPRTARYRAVQGDTGQISVRPLNRMRSVQRVRPMRFRARLLPRTLWRPGGPYARLVPASASTGFRDRQAGLFQPHMYALSGSRAFHRFLRASQAPVRLPTYSKVVP